MARWTTNWPADQISNVAECRIKARKAVTDSRLVLSSATEFCDASRRLQDKEAVESLFNASCGVSLD